MEETINFWKLVLDDLDDRKSFVFKNRKLFPSEWERYIEIKTFPDLTFAINKDNGYIWVESIKKLPEETLEKIKEMDVERIEIENAEQRIRSLEDEIRKLRATLELKSE